VVGNKSEGGKAQLRDGTVEFREDVRSSLRFSEYNHRAKISGSCFAAKVLIVSGIANEDEGSLVKVEILDVVFKSSVEFSNGRILSLEDRFLDFCKILRPFSKLDGTGCDEVFSWEGFGESRSQVCHFGEVKGEEGFDAMSDVVRRVTGQLLNQNSFRPEDSRGSSCPMLFLTFGGLDKCFTNIQMSSLDNAVGLGVVRGNLDVIYFVFC
jgi:hypothetical protein